jgi:predicted dithiol-disulfide oxidoreductase (DUF899 family)
MNHRVVDHAAWEEARRTLLAKEKEFLKSRDALAAARRELPWERVEKRYVFESTKGKLTLPELFQGRSQLVVYHFMFGADWEEGCKSCSFWADNFERSVVHLAHRDVTLLAISRGPLAKLHAFRARMGWTFDWVSSGGTDFNQDYFVSYDGPGGTYNYRPRTGEVKELPGFSVFAKNEAGDVFHTYSTYSRGIDHMNATYQILDLVPKGRNEEGLPYPMSWLRHRDKYDDASA